MGSKLVIFDLDNTLVMTRPAAKIAYKNAINHIAKATNRYQDHKKLYNHWKKIVQKVMGEKKPQMRRFEYSLGMLLEKQGIADSYLVPGLRMYEKELLHHLEPQAGAKDLLKWLREQYHSIAISTASGRSEAKKKLKSTDLFRYIDSITTSDDVGSMKPHPGYYNIPLEEFKVKPEQAVAIGDNQAEDLEPAMKLGLETILIPQGKFHLGEIKEQLEEMLG